MWFEEIHKTSPSLSSVVYIYFWALSHKTNIVYAVIIKERKFYGRQVWKHFRGLFFTDYQVEYIAF